MRDRRRPVAIALALAGPLFAAAPSRADGATALAAGAGAWAEAGTGAIRGVTVGPIESALHPGRGYGTDACARTMRQVARMGGTWASLTPFGRVLDLRPSGIDWSFEAPWREGRAGVVAAARQAHAEGLRVMIVPHLWVESGQWRALVDPGDDEAWDRWAAAYRAWIVAWAEAAREARAEMFSVGVELRSWVTTARASSFLPVIAAVREVYPGLVTYSGNWDDVDDTVILGALDVVGVNAFYPLADRAGAGWDDLSRGGRAVAEKLRRLATTWQRPVVLTEIGYTARPDPAVRPWEWPDTMRGVRVDQEAQALAYAALVAPLLDEPAIAGFFVWRVYADPDDVSQEAEWGFSPHGKLAEIVVRDAFAARWAADGAGRTHGAAATEGAEVAGKY